MLVSGLGALLAIGLSGLIGHLAASQSGWAPLIVAPMGASAVLLFAVPSSPLAQPWSIVGGNVLSALVGIGVGQAVGDPVLATGVAVALAILVMSMTHCLHPPGGAVALMTVMATQQNGAADFFSAFAPVGLNRRRWSRWGWSSIASPAIPTHMFRPRRPRPSRTRDRPPQARGGFQVEDLNEVLAECTRVSTSTATISNSWCNGWSRASSCARAAAGVEIIHRPKRGFTMPFEYWLRDAMRPVMEESLRKIGDGALGTLINERAAYRV